MRAAVLTISTSLAGGEGEDVSGPRLGELCRAAGLDVVAETVADDRDAIAAALRRALRERGIAPDIVPERAVAEGLVEALADVPVRRALVCRAAEGRDVLPDALRARGAAVDVVALYETVAEPLPPDLRAAAAAADYLLFASGSSVRFYAAAGGSLAGPRLVSIGPATSDALREHGAAPDLEADPHTTDGMIDTLVRDGR
jgi:uroporphyrinogen III methyltransferase/synthase